MQDAVECYGIVLSSMPVGEADRRVLLLTKELGRVSAFARGARRPTSGLVGSTRPFAFGRFSLYPGKSAYTLQKAEIREYFEPLVKDVEKSMYGCSFLETASYFGRENADEGELLSLLYYGLKALLNEHIPDPLAETVFELKTLMQNGLVPDFSHCRKCRREIRAGVFLPSLMGMTCGECTKEEDSGYPLSESAVYALEYIRQNASGRLFSFSVGEEILKEIRNVTDLFFCRNIDRSLPAREMLRAFTAADR